MADFAFDATCWPPFEDAFARTGHWPMILQGQPRILQLTTLAEGTSIRLLVTVPNVEDRLPTVDLGSLRNRVREFAQWTLNVNAFATGEFRSLEVTHFHGAQGSLVFSASAMLSEMRRGKPAAQAAAAQNLTITPHTVQFLAALKSLQLAIQEPDETPFLAYRAVESIRHAYYLPGENRRRLAAESWKRMWLDLGLSADRTRAIQDHAEEIRHGGHTDVTWTVRQDAISAALEVLDAFALRHVWKA